ncbi:MAG: putative rane protein [Schlesneria sp.]|nr:putative rane protein [Schlesneria sp.]
MNTEDLPTETVEADQPAPVTYNDPLKLIRQLVVFLLGMSVVVVGIAMIVLPGPATIVIPAGLAILATEFVWAKRWLDYLKRRAQEAMDWTANSVGGSDTSGKDEDKSSTASGQ